MMLHDDHVRDQVRKKSRSPPFSSTGKQLTKQKLKYPMHRCCEQPVINSVDLSFCDALNMNEMQSAQNLTTKIANISIC
jgi:hypothetical protein